MRLALVTGLLAVAVLQPAAARARASDCFDAQVEASIVRQTPTVAPDCGLNCILMRWPWIIELEVERVIAGKVPSSPLTVLTVQHTYYRTDLGPRRWWLRRNTLGVFNVLSESEAKRLPRCPKDIPAAAPYIQPAAGRSLQDLAREGEEHYGKRS